MAQAGLRYRLSSFPADRDVVQLAIWARRLAPNLARMCSMRAATVFGAMKRTRAISRLVAPEGSCPAQRLARLAGLTGMQLE